MLIGLLDHFSVSGCEDAQEFMAVVLTDWALTLLRFSFLLAPSSEHLSLLIPLKVMLHDPIIELPMLIIKFCIGKYACLQ